MINMSNQMLYQMDVLNNQNYKVNYQMSSGNALEYGSDDSNLYSYILSIEHDLKTYQGIEAQLNMASVYNQSSDTSLGEVKTQMEYINSEVLGALNAGVDDGTRSSMSEDLASVKDSMVNMLNEQANGQYIYSGTSVDTEPFVIQADGSVEYEGSLSNKEVLVDDGYYKEQGVTGMDIMYYTTSSATTGQSVTFTDDERLVDSAGNEWQFVDYDGDGNIDKDRVYKNGDITSAQYLDVTNDGATPPTYSAVNTTANKVEAKHNYFDVLDDVINALDGKDSDGNPISREEADDILRASLDLLELGYDSANSTHAVLGSRNASFENYSLSVSTKITNYEILYEESASADLTKLAIDSAALELTYSALYSTISKVNSLSLINYVK